MGSRLTGRKFSLFRGSFFLNKGNTCACFSPSGNFPNLYVVFIRLETVPLTLQYSCSCSEALCLLFDKNKIFYFFRFTVTFILNLVSNGKWNF